MAEDGRTRPIRGYLTTTDLLATSAGLREAPESSDGQPVTALCYGTMRLCPRGAWLRNTLAILGRAWDGPGPQPPASAGPEASRGRAYRPISGLVKV